MDRNIQIKLPKSILDFSEEDRAEVLATLREALALPEVVTLPRNQASEHNMWEPNHDPHVAELEDNLYRACTAWEAQCILRVIDSLNLPDPTTENLEKAFSPDFHAWEDGYIEKAKGKRGRISDLVHRNKERRQQFVDWVKQKSALTREQLAHIDKILRQDLPNFAKQAEDFAIRAGFMGKIRNEAERQNFETFGAFIDRFPSNIMRAEKEGVVLTIRDKEAKEVQNKKQKTPTIKQITILPLTPQEAEAVHYASISAGDKLTEVSEKHRARIKQMILQANKERWSAPELASKLYDTFGDHNRDWRRVAITELSFVVNDAYLAGLDEGERVIGMGSVSACKHCKQYVIGKEFTVRKSPPTQETYETDMLQVWAGKSNYGRRVQEYRACIPLHPNCRCRWHRVSPFYKTDGKGNLQRKTTAELIQEERAKRGLPPDPHIEEQLAKIRKGG